MRYILLFILLNVFLSGCTLAERKSEITGALDSLFTNAFPPDEPGGAILIRKGDKVVFAKGYGLSDLKANTKITTKTLFNLGSISKTFVANAILMLRDEGKLSLQDSMSKYFSNFKNKVIADKVKIKHLLTHTSGLPDIRQTKTDSIFYLSAMDQENWYPVTQTDTLAFEPGTHYEYSNPAFNGLALIVEKVANQKWQQFIEERIFKPVAMNTSTITDGPHPQTGVAHSYLRINGSWVEKDYGEEPTFAAAGNGGVWSSVEELLKYEDALSHGTFLRDSTISRSRSITPWSSWEDKAPPFIGWSWFIGKTPDGLKTVGHTGSQGGFLCNYVTVPDKGILFVILCNTPRDVDGYTKFITEWLINNNWLD